MAEPRKIALSHLVEVNPKDPPFGDDVPYVAMGDVSEDGELLHIGRRSRKTISAGQPTFRDGDVLFAKITPCMENGKGAFVSGLGGDVAHGSTEFHVLRARGRVDPRFIYQWTRTPRMRLAASAMMTGSAGQRRVPSSFFEKFEVPAFRIAEQRRIVEILDAVDVRLRLAERLIEKEISIKAGMLSVVSSEFFSGGNQSQLSDISELITSGSRGWADYYSDTGALFVRIGNLTREHINLRLNDKVFVRPPSNSEGSRTALQANDVLISITADLGIIGVVPLDFGEAYVNQHIALVRLTSKVNPRWVGHMLSSGHGQCQFRLGNDSGAKAGLNLSTIGRIQVPTPGRTVEDRMTGILDGQDAKIRQLIKEQGKITLLKQGLMDDLLSGRVRVPEAEELMENM